MADEQCVIEEISSIPSDTQWDTLPGRFSSTLQVLHVDEAI